MSLFYISELLERKAINGDCEAQYKLGVIYCIKEDKKSASYWLQVAAEHGHLRAREFLKELNKRKIIICNTRWESAVLQKISK